jgi:hypothetical protein
MATSVDISSAGLSFVLGNCCHGRLAKQIQAIKRRLSKGIKVLIL